MWKGLGVTVGLRRMSVYWKRVKAVDPPLGVLMTVSSYILKEAGWVTVAAVF